MKQRPSDCAFFNVTPPLRAQHRRTNGQASSRQNARGADASLVSLARCDALARLCHLDFFTVAPLPVLSAASQHLTQLRYAPLHFQVHFVSLRSLPGLSWVSLDAALLVPAFSVPLPASASFRRRFAASF